MSQAVFTSLFKFCVLLEMEAKLAWCWAFVSLKSMFSQNLQLQNYDIC